jgi:hypothetical protein
MPNSLPSRISAKPAADKMRTANATVAVFATLCTCVSRPRSSCLRYATASALNVGSILQRPKPAEVVGNLQNARAVGDGALARDAEVVMAKIGGRVNRSCECVSLVRSSAQPGKAERGSQ